VLDATQIQSVCAEMIGCTPDKVLFLSTGVIGARLPVDLIIDALPQLVTSISANGLGEIAQAIMTTDLVPKVRTLAIEDCMGAPFRVTGIAKGSGMIHPNMATLFGFLLTDAMPPANAQEQLRQIASRSFNRVTIDGDTSSNDTAVLWCSGRASNTSRKECQSSGLHSSVAHRETQNVALTHSLLQVSQELCRAIAADGEGATRLITVQVTGAPDENSAVIAARTIAASPLIKTAMHGRDPNWGRILAAAGWSGITFNVDQASIWIGEAEIYAQGKAFPENEPAAHLHLLSNHEIILGINLGVGNASAEVWTCDFSADYIRINADYRS
jgi:glutamate N-acetyltransferase / amino-acid N-acetyltransferase